MENFTPMNTCREQIWREVPHLYNIPAPSSPKEDVMGPEPGRWRKFHKVKTHHTKYHYQLKKEIERMILDRLLKKHVKCDTYQEL